MSKHSIGIIGMGWVGSSVAISILQRGLCQELLINDVRSEIAEGEAMDLNHGSSFYPACDVYAADIEEMVHCHAIVVTAGRGGRPEETRLDLLKDNIAIAQSISQKLAGFQGLLIIVANPADVLTYYYQQFTGLPAHRVIGTGTMLDTARLREMVGTHFTIDPRSIHAYAIGEHGDSQLVLWSQATIGGLALRKWPGWEPTLESDIAEKVRRAAGEIIRRKGATNHAIGLVTATLLKWLLRGERRVIAVSSVLPPHLGLGEVALSLPSVVSSDGVMEVLKLRMESDEEARLKVSAEVLRTAIASVR
ncbi:MAG: L-lactate dehydrogenase [Bacteroidota bacterium]